MYCPKCGTKAKPYNQFCESCGQSLSAEVSSEAKPVFALRKASSPPDEQKVPPQKRMPSHEMREPLPEQTAPSSETTEPARAEPEKQPRPKARRKWKRVLAIFLCIAMATMLFVGGFLLASRSDIWDAFFDGDIVSSFLGKEGQNKEDTLLPLEEAADNAYGDGTAYVVWDGEPMKAATAFLDCYISGDIDSIRELSADHRFEGEVDKHAQSIGVDSFDFYNDFCGNPLIRCIAKRASYQFGREDIQGDEATVTVVVETPDFSVALSEMLDSMSSTFDNEAAEKILMEKIATCNTIEKEVIMNLFLIDDAWKVDTNAHAMLDALAGGLLTEYAIIHEAAVSELQNQIGKEDQ